MTTAEIITITAGFVVPLIIAPIAFFALRPLFAIFLAEGADLLGGVQLSRADVSDMATLVARIDVAVLLVMWLAMFTCRICDLSIVLMAGITLAGVLLMITLTIMIVRAGMNLDGTTSMLIALIAFCGGNLPIIVIGGAAAALL